MFSMGQNFLNSPGAQLLGALGVHFPGAQPQASADPAQGMPTSFQPGPVINPNQPPPLPDMTLAPIPQPPHGGLFHRIASAMLGGG